MKDTDTYFEMDGAGRPSTVAESPSEVFKRRALCGCLLGLVANFCLLLVLVLRKPPEPSAPYNNAVCASLCSPVCVMQDPGELTLA
jgi:hypothetical protein